MAILKPSNISPNNVAFTASANYTFSWTNTGDRQYHYQLKIHKNSDSSLVYDTAKITSFNTFHVVPLNTLVNGTQYKYQLTVWNQLDESINSDWVLFKCSSVPTVSFSNIVEDGTIYNSQYLFQASYLQAESIAIQSWQMIVYDSNNTIISTTETIYDNPTIEYQFAGFNNNNFYYIECQVKSQDNLLATTGKIKFNVQYEVPDVYIQLQSSNLSSQGAVQLQWNVLQIIGESENTSFIGGEKLDTKNGKVWFDNGFNIDGNFTLKIWLEDIDNTIYTINTNTSITSYNIPLTDTTIIWFDNIAQTTELPLGISVGNIAPSTNNIWIEDSTLVPRTLTPIIDIAEPDVNKLWIDVGDSANDTSEIIKMLNSNGDEIKVRYYNDAFNLYKNGVYVSNVVVSSSKYYLYIQQTGETLTLHAEVIA